LRLNNFVDTISLIKCLSVLQGRFTIAAKHHISIAEIYESEIVDIEKVRIAIALLTFEDFIAMLDIFCHFRLLCIMNKLLIITKERSPTGLSYAKGLFMKF
jgi:hypothetical protein